ncbi:MAG: hypothetical protein HZB51_08675 [Chloroflexi bacterium]|nr:hypothetical protein [Chloroflexota bacterium]
MSQPLRPVKTFVLRLWREPGDSETEDGWRGLIRPLDSKNHRSSEISCRGLEDLIVALRQFLTAEMQSAPTAPETGVEHFQR